MIEKRCELSSLKSVHVATYAFLTVPKWQISCFVPCANLYPQNLLAANHAREQELILTEKLPITIKKSVTWIILQGRGTDWEQLWLQHTSQVITLSNTLVKTSFPKQATSQGNCILSSYVSCTLAFIQAHHLVVTLIKGHHPVLQHHLINHSQPWVILPCSKISPSLLQKQKPNRLAVHNSTENAWWHHLQSLWLHVLLQC